MEVFAEGMLPLVEDAPWAEELNLELGYRISDYDTSGLAETYKYGATWVPFMMDRLDRSYHAGHMQLDLDGHLLGGPKEGEKASDYFRRQLAGRIFVGFDCDDDGLGTAIQKGGREPFLFSSDFPHEVFDAEKCRHEIDELLARDDLTQADKQAALGGNALRFYSLAP